MIPTMPVYTDLSQLSDLKNNSKQSNNENLTDVARQFESLFTHMMIKSMRQASLGNDLFNSNGSEMYRDMFDKQIALSLSQGKGLGLASTMIQQMSSPKTEAVESTTQGKAAAATGLSMTTPPKADNTALKPGVTPATQQHSVQPAPVNKPAPLSTAVSAGETAPVAEPARQPNRHIRGLTPGLSMQQSEAEPNSTAVSATQRVAALKAYGVVQAPDMSVAMRNPIQASGLNSEAVAAPSPLPTEVLRLDQAQKHVDRTGTPESFIAKVWPAAQRVANDLGVSPRVLIAQAALETGWGKSMPKHADGSSGNNYFGIKSHGQWDGQQIAANTTEIVNGQAVREKADFRAYDSIESSFRDFAQFLKTNSRYEEALTVTHDANKFVDALQKAGYATDPNYADKIKSIMNGRRMNTMVAQVDTGQSARQVG